MPTKKKLNWQIRDAITGILDSIKKFDQAIKGSFFLNYL